MSSVNKVREMGILRIEAEEDEDRSGGVGVGRMWRDPWLWLQRWEEMMKLIAIFLWLKWKYHFLLFDLSEQTEHKQQLWLWLLTLRDGTHEYTPRCRHLFIFYTRGLVIILLWAGLGEETLMSRLYFHAPIRIQQHLGTAGASFSTHTVLMKPINWDCQRSVSNF